jgi:hypothetical protein
MGSTLSPNSINILLFVLFATSGQEIVTYWQKNYHLIVHVLLIYIKLVEVLFHFRFIIISLPAYNNFTSDY